MSLGRLYVTTAAIVVGMIVNSSVLGAPAAASVTLAWDPGAGNTAGYHLYVGGASRSYTNMVDTGRATSGTISGLAAGKTYYFAVTAYDVAGLESPFSPEVTYTIPANITNLARIQLRMSPSRQALISGTAPAGYVYNVQASQDLKTWASLGSVTASTSGTISYIDTATPSKVRYYRLQQTSIPANTTNLARIWLTISPSKQAIVGGTAPAGYVYNVQASSDFKTWTSLGSVTANTSGTISYNIVTTNKVRCYRLQQTFP